MRKQRCTLIKVMYSLTPLRNNQIQRSPRLRPKAGQGHVVGQFGHCPSIGLFVLLCFLYVSGLIGCAQATTETLWSIHLMGAHGPPGRASSLWGWGPIWRIQAGAAATKTRAMTRALLRWLRFWAALQRNGMPHAATVHVSRCEIDAREPPSNLHHAACAASTANMRQRATGNESATCGNVQAVSTSRSRVACGTQR